MIGFGLRKKITLHTILNHDLINLSISPLTGIQFIRPPTCQTSKTHEALTYLLFALFFSICSFWCTCHSSNSFLAFSFHSASAVFEAESYRRARARDQRYQGCCCVCLQVGVRPVRIQYWLRCKNISSAAACVLYRALRGGPSVPPSTCVGFPVPASADPPGRWLHSCQWGHWTPAREVRGNVMYSSASSAINHSLENQLSTDLHIWAL